jgi:hypothetical protein
MRRYLIETKLTILLGLVVASCGTETPEYRFNYICEKNDQSTAYSFTRSLVKQTLRSPSSAKFPSILGGNVEVKVGNIIEDDLTCEFEVRGYVDSQNGFGAMLRTNYLATVKFEAQGARWILLDIAT